MVQILKNISRKISGFLKPTDLDADALKNFSEFFADMAGEGVPSVSEALNLLHEAQPMLAVMHDVFPSDLSHEDRQAQLLRIVARGPHDDILPMEGLNERITEAFPSALSVKRVEDARKEIRSSTDPLFRYLDLPSEDAFLSRFYSDSDFVKGLACVWIGVQLRAMLSNPSQGYPRSNIDAHKDPEELVEAKLKLNELRNAYPFPSHPNEQKPYEKASWDVIRRGLIMIGRSDPH